MSTQARRTTIGGNFSVPSLPPRQEGREEKVEILFEKREQGTKYFGSSPSQRRMARLSSNRKSRIMKKARASPRSIGRHRKISPSLHGRHLSRHPLKRRSSLPPSLLHGAPLRSSTEMHRSRATSSQTTNTYPFKAAEIDSRSSNKRSRSPDPENTSPQSYYDKKKQSRQSLCHTSSREQHASPSSRETSSKLFSDMGEVVHSPCRETNVSNTQKGTLWLFDTDTDADEEESRPRTSPFPTPATHNPPSSQDISNLRSLVKRWTDFDDKEKWSQGDPSDIAIQVQRLTEYPLVPPLPADTEIGDFSSPVKTRASKTDVLSRIDLRRLDEGKIRDSATAEQVTECRVEKVPGMYVYFDMATRAYIKPQEYESRYLLMLDEINKFRYEEWKLYFDNLKQDRTAFATTVSARCFSSTHHKQPQTEVEANSPLQHPSLLCYESPNDMFSASETETSEDAHCEVSEPKHPYWNTRFLEIKRAVDLAKAELSESNRTINLSSNIASLADPEAVEAETRVLDAIENALAEYSREMIKIQARRRGK